MTQNDKLATAYGVPAVKEYFSQVISDEVDYFADIVELQHDTLRLFKLCIEHGVINICLPINCDEVEVIYDEKFDESYFVSEKFADHQSKEHAVRRAMVLALAKLKGIE